MENKCKKDEVCRALIVDGILRSQGYLDKVIDKTGLGIEFLVRAPKANKNRKFAPLRFLPTIIQNADSSPCYEAEENCP